jgi:putative flippase GtrA
VGVLGIAAQLGALAFFHRVLGWNYLVATALAVESAILHNFIWHERWTWRDRAENGSAAIRLLRFHCGVGVVSLAVNIAGMRWLAGTYRVPYLAANLLSIAAGAAANFAVADLFAFRRSAPTGRKAYRTAAARLSDATPISANTLRIASSRASISGGERRPMVPMRKHASCDNLPG